MRINIHPDPRCLEWRGQLGSFHRARVHDPAGNGEQTVVRAMKPAPKIGNGTDCRCPETALVEGKLAMTQRHSRTLPVRLSRRIALSGFAGALAIAGAAGSLAAAGPAMAVASSASCTTVHVIAARASTEAPGDGTIGSLVTLIQGDVSATVSQEAVVYPATLTNYASSVAQGDSAIKSELATDVANCPNEKFVLVGYSQGAQVVGDALGGGGGGNLGTPATAGVPAATAAKIIAVIQMGDPRRIPGLSFDVGNDPGATGLFPRPASESLSSFASKFQSYCDTGDPFCASGFNLAAHLDYTTKYNSAASSFVKGKLNAAGIS
jgi:acetylxylan esterase